jgi:hypothetical protein
VVSLATLQGLAPKKNKKTLKNGKEVMAVIR